MENRLAQQESAEQGRRLTTFTVKDIPLVGRLGVGKNGARWAGLDQSIKKSVILLIQDTLNSPDANDKEKIQAGRLAVQIDRLNLAHEKLYTPKMDIEVTDLTDIEISQQIELLQTEAVQEEILTFLMVTTEAEYIDPDILPEFECRELSPNEVNGDLMQVARVGKRPQKREQVVNTF